jgi:hypothetical protein
MTEDTLNWSDTTCSILLSTGNDCVAYIYTTRLIASLNTVRGGRQPTIAIPDVEFSGIDLPGTHNPCSPLVCEELIQNREAA